jgi:serine/threonine-protein kinase
MSGPTRIGRFEIVALLGSGGMGEVYRARDENLGRDVAIKILPAGLSSDRSRLNRFEQEAHAAGQLNHPNILAIYDVGLYEGSPYLVSELLEGETLGERLLSGSLPPSKAVEYASQLARGLAAAHEKGIVHRDLKPENLFITREGRVKILDFGLAKLTASENGSPAGLGSVAKTESGIVLGTAGYMSPEQVRGKPADYRADIFSFGAVLYEMLSGKRAFQGGSVAETLAAILHHDPPALTLADPLMASHLHLIVRHCLEKKPEDRFQSARDLSFALEALSIPSEASGSPKLRFRSIRSSGAQVKAAWLLSGVLLVLVGTWMARHQKPDLYQKPDKSVVSLAVLPFVNGSRDPDAEYLSDGITESLIGKLSQLPNLRVLARSTVFQYRRGPADPLQAGRDLKVGAVLTGRIVQRGESLMIGAELVDVASGAALWGEQYNRKLADIVSVQEEISREITSRLKLRLTIDQKTRIGKRETQDPESYQLYLRGRYQWNKRSPEGLKKSIEYFQQAIERDPTYGQAHDGLADAFDVLGGLGVMPPRETFPRARAAAQRAIEIDDTLANAHASLADVYTFYDWNWSAAEREYQRALALDPNYSTARQWYANFLLTQKRFPEALKETRRALTLDPLSLVINQNLGWVLYYCRRYDEAIQQLQKTLEMDPNFSPSRGTLAMAYEAKALYSQSVSEFQKWLLLQGVSRDDVEAFGETYAAHGRLAFLRVLAEAMEERAKGRYISAFDFVRVYAQLGRKDDAFRWLEKAYEERSAAMPYLAVDPILDVLRTDSRFPAVLARMKLNP